MSRRPQDREERFPGMEAEPTEKLLAGGEDDKGRVEFEPVRIHCPLHGWVLTNANGDCSACDPRG